MVTYAFAASRSFGSWNDGQWTADGVPIQAFMQQGASVPALPTANVLLDFTTGTLDPRITAAGGANGTRTNAAGTVNPATCPRFDYDPVSLQPLGVLMEAAATNLQIQASNYTGAPWTHTDITVTANSTLSPEGVVNGTLITEGSAGTALTINAQIGQTAGQTYTISRYFKYSNCQWVLLNYTNPTFITGANIWFDIQNGVVGANQAIGGTVTNIIGRISPAGNGWYRCSVTANLGSFANAQVRSSSAAGNLSLVPVNNAAYYMYGSQFELGTNPTSFIPTAGASVTRTADSLLMTGTNFSSWYNQPTGTMVVEHDMEGLGAANSPLFSIDDNTTGSKIVASRNITGGGALSVAVASVAQASYSTVNNALPSTISKVAVAWALNDFSLVLNGGASAVDTLGTIPTVTQMRLAGVTPVAASLNGHLRKMAYFNSRLTDAQMQALTS